MSRKPLKASDGEGFLRAFTDEWADCESEYLCRITFTVERMERKGVLRLVLAAWSYAYDVQEHPQAQYSVEYPTAAVATFEAALYQAMIKLERILQQQVKWPMGSA